MKGIRWIVLSIIILASFVAYVLRTNVNIVGETMMTDLGMNPVQLGMVFSAFAAGYAIFQFPGGIFGDRVGPRRAIAIIATAWAVLTIVTALVPGTDVLPVGVIITALVVVRFLVGAAHAPFFPVTIGGTIASWFPVRQWGLPNGLSSTGLTRGAAAPAPAVVGRLEAYGWRGALQLTAPAGFVIAIVYWWFVTDEPQDHKLVTDEELELIKSDRPAAEGKHEPGAWKLALTDRNVLLLAISYFCMNYVFYLFFNWFFFYLVDVKGFSAADAGILTAALWILGAVGATAGGFTCDLLVRGLGIRLGPRALAATGLVLSAILLIAGALTENVTLAIVALCLCFACNQLTEAPFWVATMSVAGPHAQVATGVLNTGGNVTGIVGGLLVPLTAGWFGWPAAIMTGALFALVGATLWLFVRADETMLAHD
ncbi:MAG: MFS transporter [Woeseiaceae bacterium]|nr:MFS transporter [Woeseiaceae bacterium]